MARPRALRPHPVHTLLARLESPRQSAYRALFRPHLDTAAIDDIRLALNQSQPLGNSSFLAHIQAMTVIRREARPHGRPRKEADDPQTANDSDQGKLGI